MANKYGFRATHKEPLFKRCRGCNKRFSTSNPSKEFCTDKCRVKNWARFNKDRIQEIQKRCRRNQQANLKVEE